MPRKFRWMGVFGGLAAAALVAVGLAWERPGSAAGHERGPSPAQATEPPPATANLVPIHSYWRQGREGGLRRCFNPSGPPAGLLVYDGRLFPQWQGSIFIGGLSSESLVRIAIDGTTAREAERFDMDARIREVEQGPDGALWLLEDQRDGSGGRLLKLTPVTAGR